MKFLLADAISALPITTAAMTSTPASAQAAAEGASGVDPDAIRCEWRSITGSRVRKLRICTTNEEWRAIKRKDRDGVVEINAEQQS